MAASPRPRVVLVVGASSGIGRATAQRLAARGDHLVLAARAEDPLEDAVEECLRRGAASARAATLDVRDRETVQQAVEQLLAEHGRLDALVHAAAVVAVGRFEDVPGEVFDAVVETNVLGVANVARAVLPAMRARGAGNLVLLGSVLGQTAAPSMTPYVVSKWAVRSLGRQLQLENRDVPGLHVTVVSPGPVDTPIYRQAANYQGNEAKAPFPVEPADRVADAVVSALDRPRPAVSVGWANPLMRLGFTAVPFLYDALVGPLMRVLAMRPDPAPPTSGNVLDPQPELESVSGGS